MSISTLVQHSNERVTGFILLLLFHSSSFVTTGKILMKCADRTSRSFKSGSIFFDNKLCAVRRIAERV